MLTTEQAKELTLDVMLGRESTITGPEADAYKEECKKSVEYAKSKNWTIAIPGEWEV